MKEQLQKIGSYIIGTSTEEHADAYVRALPDKEDWYSRRTRYIQTIRSAGMGTSIGLGLSLPILLSLTGGNVEPPVSVPIVSSIKDGVAKKTVEVQTDVNSNISHAFTPQLR